MSIDRMMQLYEPEGDNVVPVDHASIAYKHTTLAYERQLADDLAKELGYRQGEAVFFVFDLETDEIIKELELAP